jgi:GNAT superfamily N-acetyltransferase
LTLQTNYEVRREDFCISTDKKRLDIEVIHHFLENKSYWSKDIPLPVVRKAVSNSLCFGVFKGDEQVGFARVVSDYVTFAWLADVFILKECRGIGLSKWMLEVIMSHPDLQVLRRWMLATRDAHGLYAKYGFKPIAQPERLMENHQPEVFKNA